MIKITQEQAVQMIENSNGAIFSVDFIKRSTNETRTMICRFGPTVSKGLSGGELPYNPKNRGLIPVYLMNGDENKYADSDRRMINVDGLLSLSINGEKYVVE